MQALIARLKMPQTLIALVGFAALGLVGGGLFLAKTLNLAACPLCILQRMGYLLLAIEAMLAFGVAYRWPSPRVTRIAALAMLPTTLTGAGIAGYQTWLQRFAKDTSCTANQPWWETFVDWAGQQAPFLFEATGLCSEAGWKFMHLSIAEWSLIAFTTMTVMLLYAATRNPSQNS